MGAELVEAGNWAAVAVWFPPDVNYIPPDIDRSWQEREFWEAFTPVRQQHLRGRKHWYLNLLGRHPERSERGQLLPYKKKKKVLTTAGVVRALIDPYLERARAQGVPVWLECMSEHGRQVYEHLSFRTVAEVRLGVGKVNASGEPDEKGEGLTLYAMMAE
ncbi:hypothetical protein T310_3804 [Rasamsonia emersonii CBS 393.64]|uniref:N-acetyltransferase domain-containing protein n=1 Tax=Rasamsonia emersonii (strain ATCC 16479 / CBS 393.64 / IMI 116815) TaxID=1408163 RepID=A0A0F4YV71_RASE3|nr:hypothetical protein T310_3804 [Rasamsonia emersonii CBS 393.64]KKA22167.1 hypothetical protein T310_3804 [Rasamsonia emersonii CBS 393.64]